MLRKPINLKFNGMSQRQASAIADATIGSVVDHFRRAAAEEAAIAAAAFEQDAAMDHSGPYFMSDLYDDDGEPRGPLDFLDDLPGAGMGGFDCYGANFRTVNFRI